MANVTEISQFDTGIYQLEITDPVEGGPGGISNAQAIGLANRTRWLKDNAIAYFAGELKWLGSKDQAFIDANFPSGLGTGIYSGWAVANGANGTDDMGGKVPVAYGNGYAVGAVGGSADAVVVSHIHKTVATVNPSSDYNSTSKYTAAYRGSGGNAEYGLQGTASAPNTGDTTSTGVSGTDKNMQPYRVILCIQKI